MVLQDQNREQSTPGAGGQWVGFVSIKLPLWDLKPQDAAPPG